LEADERNLNDYWTVWVPSGLTTMIYARYRGDALLIGAIGLFIAIIAGAL
jgi:hypothetical protein